MRFRKAILLGILAITAFCGYASDVYWVGGSGNWNDPAHWSNTSGGISNTNVPTPGDNVIFDGNSFQTANTSVTINSNVSVNGLEVREGTSPFALNSNSTISVFGSIAFNVQFPIEFMGTIKLKGNSPQNLDLGNVTWDGNLTIESSSNVNIQSNLVFPDGTIDFKSGHVQLNGNDVVAGSFVSAPAANRSLNASGSSFLINDTWDVHTGQGIDLSNSNVKVLTDKVFNYSGTYPLIQVQNMPSERFILSIDVNDTIVSCGNVCDGMLIVDVLVDASCGGVFTIQWYDGATPIPGATDDTLDGLCPGAYTVVVEDCSGLPVSTSGDVDGHPAIFQLGENMVEPICKDSCNGSLTVSVAGGGAPLTYQWCCGGPAVPQFNDLCAGLYTLDVTDNIGCDTTFEYEVTEPEYVEPNVLATPADCNGACTGMASSSPTGGNGDYSYMWSPGNETTPSISGLCPGGYSVTVTDSAGCTGSENYNITEPPPITLDTTHVNVSCGGACDATISVVNINGGTPPYTHSWNTGSTNFELTNLCPGVYADTVSDSQGCDTIVEFTVTEPTPLTLTMSFNDVSCFGFCDGDATGTPGGGTPPYDYSWSNSGTTQTINGLCPGTYVLTVTDANNCTIEDSVEITEPAEILLSTTVNDISCNGACDGSIDASASGGTGGFNYEWFDCSSGVALSPPQTNATATGLCPGDYYVEVTDASGCAVDNSAACDALTDPAPISISIDNTTDATCGGACDGTATASANGGTGNLTISWYNAVDDSQEGTGNSINTLCTGTYYAVVTDDNGCDDTTAIFTINDAVLVTGTITANDATCAGFCDGSATVVPSGGTAPYTYDWVEVSTGNTILSGPNDSMNGLCAGDYTIQVIDDNGCSSPPIPFTINDNPAIVADATVTDATCNGDCDGTAVSNASGGSGGLTYTWTPNVTGQGTPSASQLCAGNYNLHIEDNIGCFIDTTITINEPAPFDFTFISTDETCTGDCDGTADVVLNSGGTAPIDYTWSPAPGAGQGSPNATGMCPNNYSVVISDAGGCDTTVNFVVNVAPAINLNAIVSADNACNGDCSGVAQANASGGTGTLTYTWTPNPPTGQGTNTASDLCAGNYSVEVEDDNGCTETDNVTITEPAPYDITSSFNDVSCNGDCDGDATVTVNSGGTPNYSYSWNDPLGQNTPTAGGLCAGNYDVTISDLNGCDSIVSFTISEPAAITISINSSGSTCFGNCTGSATATTGGGAGGITVEWFDNATGVSQGTGNSISSLCPGDYYAVATDASGCSNTSNVFTITEDPTISLSASTTLSNCAVCDGTATISASGGSGSFVNYTWSPAVTGQGTPNGTGMCAGVYTVDVEDSNGCTETIIVTISDVTGETITPDSTDATCFGGCDGSAEGIVVCGDPICSFQWYDNSGAAIPGETNSTISGLCAGTYVIEVTNGSGCIATEDIEIGEGNEILPNESFTDPLCNGDNTGTATVAPTGGAGGFIYTWAPNPPGGQGTASATGLSAGNWSVTIEDANGCDTTVNFTLTDPPVLDVSNTTSSDISCFGANDGVATVFPTGGVGTYSYEWFECITDIPVGQTSQQATGLGPGSYYAVVTDQAGCAQTTACVDINEPAQLTGMLSSVDITCNGACNGTGQVVPVGGINNYSYQWFDDGSGTPITGGTGDIVTNLCPGTYSVEITDLNNCTEMISSITINEPQAFSVSTVVSDASCFGTCDGTADLTVSGGTAAYSYTWSPAPGTGQGTANASDMCAGTYSVLIEDAAGCDTTISVVIASPSEILANATITQITCGGDSDGAIQTTVTGGAGNYQYNWTPNGETTPGISGLSGGTYTVTIQDADGCMTDTTVNLIDPTPITATTSTNSSTCNQCDGAASVSPSGGYGGFTYSWSPSGGSGQIASNLCAGIYTVTVTDQGGCAEPITVTVSDIGAESVSTSSTDASCFDTNDGTATATYVCGDPACTVEWYDAATGQSTGITVDNATGLGGGDYYVEVINNSGCITIEPVTVNAPSEIIANEIITPVVCATDSNGVIEVNPSGGSGAGYTYNWTPAPGGGQGTNIATGLYPGNWDVLITDGTGCDTTYTFTIPTPSTISTTLTSSDVDCNGAANGSAEVVATGGSFPYTYQWQDAGQIDIPGETNSTLSGVGAGDYYVVVTDQNGCSVTDGPVTVNEPTALSATITSNDVLCNGQCTGEGTVTPSGGTGNYTVNWYDNASGAFIGLNGTNVTTLCPGDYYAVVTDDNGCQFTTNVITIAEPTAISATVSGTDASCDGACDGTATVVPAGGTPAYLYNWLDGQGQAVSGGGGANVSSLCPDNYTVEVFDQNGCSVGPLSVTISGPSALTGNVFINDASCTVNDGSATIDVSGGTQPYTYQWFDNTMTAIGGETDSIIQNQGAGTYFVEVVDAAGCSDIFQANIGNLDGPVITVDSVNNVPCFGGMGGDIYTTVTGVSAPFTYTWNPGGQVGEDLLNVGGGTYTLEVEDAAGCIAFETVDIIEGNEIFANFSVTDATCGLCDGEITVNGVGGTGTLSYDWTTGQTGSTISSLCVGTYSVNVSDDNGCVENFTVGVTNTGGPTGESIAANDPSCFGGSDGDATVTPIGGTPPYSYYWIHDGGTTNSASGLSSGLYYLQVTDDNGCVRTVEVSIGDPAPITDMTNITPATCGVCDGEITASGDGGTAPFSYQWSHGPTSQTISGLCEGLYYLDIIDANGCTETFQYGVNGSTAPTLSLSPSDASCDGACDGEITSDTTGGAQPMTYEWLDDQGNPIGQTSSTATGLCIGEYILEVTDANGCLSFAQAEIDGPTGFQFSLPTTYDALCAGSTDGEAFAVVIGGTLPYTYNWTPAPGGGQGTSHATGLGQGTYTVEVTDANGCTDQQDVTINEPLPIAIALDTLHDALCYNSNDGFIEITASGGTPGYTYSWVSDPAGYTSTDEDIDSLYAQDYIITVTDANNCTLTDTFAVDTTIVVLADAGPDTTYCSGASFDILGEGTGSSSLTYTWYDDLGNVIDSDSLLTINETNGTFTYILEVADGACLHTDTVEVTVNPIPTVDAGPDIDIVKGETTVIGGSPTAPSGSDIAWDPPYYMDDSTLFNPAVNPDTTTTYIVYVVDPNGCVNSDTITVSVYPDIVFPNGFSPNGDGVNETWEIDFIDQFPESVVEVYNRWGELLFRSVGYVEEWDGNYNGQPLPVGTYYYVINLNHPLYPDVFTGPITILR